MTSRVLPGHALQREGAPHDANGAPLTAYYYGRRGGEGRAKCQCGTLSEILDSARQRKQWHREVHKPEIREGES
jgi:hypothetical protein